MGESRQTCPKCGEAMQVTYRPTSLRSDYWRLVWYCAECRHEIPIPGAETHRIQE